MNVALFTNTNTSVYNRQENNNQKPETMGSIAFVSKPATSLFKRNDEVAIAKDTSSSVETAGSIACTSGLGGQAQTSSAGSSLSVAA